MNHKNQATFLGMRTGTRVNWDIIYYTWILTTFCKSEKNMLWTFRE
uniref:Uncharacterized protein n=1 Tax=Rhizophora mucronata TaxID=61149 RepID=A0A2P2N0F3_RHIMU